MADKAPQYLFVSQRNQTIRSTQGHSITFVKGKATHVPRAMHTAVLEKGIVPCDEAGKALPEKGEELVEQSEVKINVPPEGEERADKLVAIFKSMVETNNPKEFTGGGRPHAEAVSSRAGFKVDQKEVNDLWVKNRASLLGAKSE